MLITSTIKSVEWLDIDSGMLKLIEKIANHCLEVITQCLSTQLKIVNFPVCWTECGSQTKIINSLHSTADDASHIN